MTKTEFENYLKSIGGLTSAYTGVTITSPGAFAFGAGWYDITRKLIDDLIALGWDKHLAQAKEKWGGGRFYIGAGSKEIFDRIREWEQDTYTVCEDCGTSENVTVITTGWVRTLCPECDENRNKNR